MTVALWIVWCAVLLLAVVGVLCQCLIVVWLLAGVCMSVFRRKGRWWN